VEEKTPVSEEVGSVVVVGEKGNEILIADVTGTESNT